VTRHPSADPAEAFDGLVTAANDGPGPGAGAASGSHTSPTRTDAGPEHRDGWSRNRLSAAVAAIRGNQARPAGDRPLADEIEFFATIGARRNIPHGVALARRGTTTGEVHLVERGALALVDEHDGRRPIVAFAVRREFCGSVPALLHEPEPWDAVAVMDTSVITMPAARFSAAVQDRWVDRWARSGRGTHGGHRRARPRRPGGSIAAPAPRRVPGRGVSPGDLGPARHR